MPSQVIDNVAKVSKKHNIICLLQGLSCKLWLTSFKFTLRKSYKLILSERKIKTIEIGWSFKKCQDNTSVAVEKGRAGSWQKKRITKNLEINTEAQKNIIKAKWTKNKNVCTTIEWNCKRANIQVNQHSFLYDGSNRLIFNSFQIFLNFILKSMYPSENNDHWMEALFIVHRMYSSYLLKKEKKG